MKKKIEYSTPYAEPENINGYVIAEDCGGYYKISRRQYNRAISNLTIGNTSPVYHADKIVVVDKIDWYPNCEY